MQKLQDSVFSIVKTTNLSPAVFSFLQPTEDFSDKTPLGGILKDTKHGWLALGPKFCVVDLRTGLKVAARTFGAPQSNINTFVTSVVELPRPLTSNSVQLIISLQCDEAGMICVLHVNGSQILRCIQTEVVVTELAVWDRIPDGPLTCFDGVVMAGTKSGEIFAFDLHRAGLMQALKDISQGYENLVLNETNPANLSFLQFSAIHRIREQRELALENCDHLAILLNENSLVDGQYIFRNPDGSVRMKAKRDHIRVTVLQYIPQLGSLAVGYNFGAFQIWNIMTLDLEFTSQVNVECLPVTHFGFQEPCDDPRAFCYLWVVFSVIDRFEEEEFPLAVMYSLTYQGKRMLSDTKCLYQEFSTATIRFQLELSTVDESALLGGKCVSCHTYSVNSTLAAEGEDSMLNICQVVWECWGENANSSTQYGMLLFDLDQWYKDQMPATWRLESAAFMSVTWCGELSAGDCVTLDVRLAPASVAVYSHATRLEEHFYPNSLQYNCICLNTSEACVLGTVGIQRQIVASLDDVGPTALLNPTRLYNACVTAGLTPLYVHTYSTNVSLEEQRRYLLSVCLEARLSRLLKRCAHDWATGTHAGAGCTLPFLVDWSWKRAIELKENAKELTAPLFSSSALPDRNVVRCLEHCVQQLTQLTGLLDAVLTKCCNLIIPDALSEIEEKYKGIGTVSLYFQVVQWFLRVGLLPERHDAFNALPYPAPQLYSIYNKRRLKLNRLQDNAPTDENEANKPCSLLYIDQLIEQEFGGERTHQLWMKGGSQCNGLYPPPSLYSLLRLYLLPDIAEEHKHSLVLYLLVDYSMVYDEVRYEAVIRRLMQFPTMFGLSNTAIKATQAFWHLDHRDFDFALDQLQCLTGNTLSDWQHNVVLSTLLAQKKTQAALQYLHVRKPAPIQNIRDRDGDIATCSIRVNDHDKLEDWQSCCNLYLARGLVFEALDVIRMCVMNAGCVEDKVTVMQYFFKGCRNTGNLSKILQVTMSPFEEEMFVKYLEDCNEPHTSDILVMYYLQQSRYLEAERYNNKLKQGRAREVSRSAESLLELCERDGARDALVHVARAALPAISATVAHYALHSADVEPHVIAPKPMSVFVKAKSPKNTFTYKSSFIQDTIENASETWVNKPKMRRGIKRALNIEETPFICTPKLNRTRSILATEQKASESTPPKRARLDLSGTPRTPKMGSFRVSEKLSSQMATLLDMPDVQSPECKLYTERAGTPHSILKTRRTDDMDREAPSPVDSRYLGDSDDELLETASNHTHYSDSTNKHLRFTIPTASESGSTPSPPTNTQPQQREKEMENSTLTREKEIENATLTREKEIENSTLTREKEMDVSIDSFVTTTSHAMTETHPMESPPKRLATEESVKGRKSFKDTVRARRSLSLSVNSSLSDDPNTSIESIADIPVTLINPRYSGEKRHYHSYNKEQDFEHTVIESVSESQMTETAEVSREVPKTPRGRRGIRASGGESTPLRTSRNVTPERVDSPVATSLRGSRITRSRSRTPELSPRTSPLAPIPELPRHEAHSEPHAEKTTLSIPRRLRSRSRTPDRVDKPVSESPKLEAITESPTKSTNTESSSSSSPTPRSLRSRSRTPEIEVVQEIVAKSSPRSLRSRSKTPERQMSPKIESPARSKQAKPSLSRKAFENILSAKVKQADKMDADSLEDKPEISIECTPMKPSKQVPNLMDVTLSPIVNKSVLQSSTDSTILETVEKEVKTDKSVLETDLKPFPAFTTLHETCIEKSVLHSYQSSVAEITDTSINIREEKVVVEKSEMSVLKPLPAFTLNETEFDKSVLKSYQSSVADESSVQEEKETQQADNNTSKPFAAFVQMIQTDFENSVLHSAESSVAEASQLKDDSKVQEASSLMTNDSDADMDMEENVDNKKSAAEQKEKEKIVEIEREIGEIQDMSDEDEQDASESSGEEGEDDGESGSEASDDEIEQIPLPENEELSKAKDVTTNDGKICVTLNASSTSNERIEENDEVISIEDSDDSSDKLQIDEKSKDSRKSEDRNVNIETQDKGTVQDEIISEDVLQVESTDKFNQANFSLMTDDNSIASDKSDLNLNYSGESGKTNVSDVKVEAVEKEPIVELEVRSSENKEKEPTPEPTKVDSTTQAETPNDVDVEIIEIEQEPTSDKAKESEKDENIPETVTEVVEVVEVPIVTKVPETTEQETKDIQKETEEEKSEEQAVEKDVGQPTRSRKRGKSTSSNISATEEIPSIDTEVKTPATRKRTQSTASNKSMDAEQKTPESTKSEVTTPSRRRAKTPTSAEVRKIITRRVSREMSEKHDESKALDESISTPKRRSNRSRSKNFDDNESVASESSIASIRSKASEDAGDRAVRKGRKSVLASKPELSVIPEVTVEDNSKMETENVISEYSSARRLTRHQKAVLESWLEPQPHASPRRRLSTASRTSRTSHTSRSVASEADDDDASSTHSAAFDVQPIDRISLLNKTDFEARLGRAASETKVTPRAAKINRRISVDVADGPDSSPVPMGSESPARGRRKSFNRACEALHTPKGRRTSTDLRKGDAESPIESPVVSESEAVTPARRTRRAASTVSNTSQANSETGKRSKKTVLDESKDTKKK
ncbi:protein ELYS isoform X2 [Spodoptera litura]|uniref:Protein ELYS isoform X2 n=1 Tax=Spodoptera litura TaxID=69820 RepID=A0A9J7EKS1_SPOLT|nr:protein ELYS isoform X2 [Spodoptera litura]